MQKLLIILVGLLLAGCVSQPAIPTLQPTSTLSATPTLQPTLTFSATLTLPIFPTNAEAVHRWDTQPVLAQLYQSAGFSGDLDAWAVLPTVVVYADGRVITTLRDYYHYSMHAWTGTIRLAHVSHDELCSLLTKIDQSGFFDFSPADYIAPTAVYDRGNTDIIVNSWRSNYVSMYAFEFLSDRPRALAEPYGLLLPYSYDDTRNTTPYQVERLALLVRPWGTINYSSSNPWPATLPPLKKFAPGGDQTVSVLTGQDITEAYNFFTERGRLYVSDDGLSYGVAIRPLLPFEIPTVDPWSPSKFEESPKVPITCDPFAK